MILCLVTDRRRLGAALGASAKATGSRRSAGRSRRPPAPESTTSRSANRTSKPAQLVELVRSLMRDRLRTRPGSWSTTARRRAGRRASGVHLKEQSILPAEVRRIAPPGFVIGCSVHGISGVAARKSADLLIAGTVLPTASKPAVDYLDEDGLRQGSRGGGGAAGARDRRIGSVRRFRCWLQPAQPGWRRSAPSFRRRARTYRSLCRNVSAAMRLAFDSARRRT